MTGLPTSVSEDTLSNFREVASEVSGLVFDFCDIDLTDLRRHLSHLANVNKVTLGWFV